MMDCKGPGRSADELACTSEEIMKALRRRSQSVVAAADTRTLHRAVTTADEVRKYLKRKQSTWEWITLNPSR